MVFPFPRHGRRQAGERDVATLCNYVGEAYLDLTALTKKMCVHVHARVYICVCAHFFPYAMAFFLSTSCISDLPLLQ